MTSAAPVTHSTVPTPGAVTRYRVMAWVTGVVLALSTFTALRFWPWYVGPGIAGALWTAHGWLYLLYVAATLQLAYQVRWHPVRVVLMLLAGTVPFMSFIAERAVVTRLRQEGSMPGSTSPGAP